jgi:hypothetical protein
LGLDTVTSLLPERVRILAVVALLGGMAALDAYGLFKSIPFLMG